MKVPKIYQEILSGLGILIFAIALYSGWQKKYYIDKKMAIPENTSFTIGKVTSIQPGGRMSRRLNYHFFEEKIESRDASDSSEFSFKGKYDAFVGKYYLIKFLKEDPEYSNELLFKKRVPDSLVKCCRYDIWEKPPF